MCAVLLPPGVNPTAVNNNINKNKNNNNNSNSCDGLAVLSVYAVQTATRRLTQVLMLQTCIHEPSYNPSWDINHTEILCSFL
jgi:hypothetical protein